MSLYTQLAFHFICKKNSKKLSFTSWVSIIGAAFGVAAFLVVITVLTSFQKEMKHIISSINPHLVVFSQTGISNAAHFKSSLKHQIGDKSDKQSLFIFQESIVSHGAHTAAVYLRAIEGDASASAKQLSPLVAPQGAFHTLNNPSPALTSEGHTISSAEPSQYPHLILGKELAEKLDTKPGDVVVLMNFSKTHYGVTYEKLYVSGIIHIGISQYDKQYGLMNFSDGQKMFGTPGWASGVEVSLFQPHDALSLASRLNDELPYTVIPWQDIDKDLFHQIERDSTSIKLIVFIISFVAGFNIIITLTLTVMDRSKQIALLRSLGARKIHIVKTFLYCGTILGVIGSLLGIVFGFILIKIFSGLSIGDFQDFYYLEKIPAQMDFNLVIIAFSTSLLLSFFGAMYPAWRATKVSPLLGLKN